jgi:chromate transporter
MSPTLRDAFPVWLRIGLLSFGGPAGQIALMHRMLVQERRWIEEPRFLHALNYCMLLPGPEAQQLATYIGWLLHGTRGGLVAGVLFVLPGLVVITAIAVVYVLYGDVGVVRGVLYGMQAATLAIVAAAVVRIGGKTLHHPLAWTLAASAFVALFAFNVPFPVVILAAAALGMAGAWLRPGAFAPQSADDGSPSPAPVRTGWILRVLLSGGALWGTPVLALLLVLGAGHVFADQAVFFSKMAVVTFGGAYATLAYMTQQAVERYGWVSPDQMLQGLALAETTPGPLILVVTFVAFLGAYGDSGSLDPVLAGLSGAAVATWVTFVPCFLWIFLGAPYVERLRGQRQLAAALAGITAAVVGVILSLSLWFAMHVLFDDVGRVRTGWLDVPWPQAWSLDLVAAAIAAFALLALLRFRIGLLPTLAACAGWGLLATLLR